MIDSHAAMAEFVRAYDEMRECQVCLTWFARGDDRGAAVYAVRLAERKCDALRLRVVLPDELADAAQLPL
jgi:hypothetical protein